MQLQAPWPQRAQVHQAELCVHNGLADVTMDMLEGLGVGAVRLVKAV